MDKITKVNVEGDEYGFVAGQTVKGVSGALASDYVKHVILPEGAEVVEGMLIAVTFVNDNTAGYSGEKTVYSTDGINFYWDSGYTQLITLPPQGCYTVTATETQYEYKLSEYPVLVMGAMTKPFCDSRGHPAGGKLWQAGDTVTVINLENRFIALQTTVNEIIQGSSLPVTSGAVYEKCNSLEPVNEIIQGSSLPVTSGAVYEKCNSLEPVDEVTSGNQHSVTSSAVAGVIQAGNFLSGGIKLYTQYTRNVPVTDWTDIVTHNDIPSGTYLFVLKIHDAAYFWFEYVSFVMYFYAGSTNDGHSSTIYFNQAGHAPNQATVQLLYQRRPHDTGDGSIRIYLSKGVSVIPVKIRIYKIADEFN